MYIDAEQGLTSLAPAEETMVRLYRGQSSQDLLKEIPNWIKESVTFSRMIEASGRWFTPDYNEALWYMRDHDSGELVFIDVPAQLVEEYRVSNIALKLGGKDVSENPRAFSKRPELEFFIPKELARQAQKFTFPVENLDLEASFSPNIR